VIRRTWRMACNWPMDFRGFTKGNGGRSKMRSLLTRSVTICLFLGVLSLASPPNGQAQEQNRSGLKPSQAIVGRWALNVKGWLGFGDWKRGVTVSEYRSDRVLTYYEKDKVTSLVYSILNEDERNGTLDLSVKNPSTGGGHIKHIQFSSDRMVFYEEIRETVKSVRTKQERAVKMESKNEYLGPPN
jgi:hypothetical protein